MSTKPVQRIYEFNKAALEMSIDTSRAIAEAMTDGATRAWQTLRDTGATFAGQTRSVVDRTAADVSSGGREVAGQARAQGKRAGDQLDAIADQTARRATLAVDRTPSSGTPYEQWTRADLYERARELDIDGRSTMSKQELIEALRAS